MPVPADPILLLSTYELGHQPLNLASPMAALAEDGYRPVAVDTSVTPLTRHVVEAAWFVAISLPMHTATRLAIPLIAQIRTWNPETLLCCYGLYATLNDEFLFSQGVDYVIGGEYEAPLLALVEALSDSDETLPDGVATPTRAAAPNLAKIPFAVPHRYALPPLRRYAHFEQHGRQSPAGYVEASRGCLHTCLHCPITPVYEGRFFVVPHEVVLADIRAQVEMGAGHITFGDPDFFNGPGHSLKIVRAMHREFPDLSFDITTKIEHILKYRRYFPELSALGCAFVVSAVESFSDRVLARLAKGHNAADVPPALEILNAAEISLRPSLVAFTPWTSLEDYRQMLAQVERLGLIQQIDPVQYSIRLLVPPHSALVEQPEAQSWLGPLQAETLTHRWLHTDPRMDRLHQLVSDLVAQATGRGLDTTTTFFQVRQLADSMARGGRQAVAPSRRPARLEQSQGLPRLTETWFC